MMFPLSPMVEGLTLNKNTITDNLLQKSESRQGSKSTTASTVYPNTPPQQVRLLKAALSIQPRKLVQGLAAPILLPGTGLQESVRQQQNIAAARASCQLSPDVKQSSVNPTRRTIGVPSNMQIHQTVPPVTPASLSPRHRLRVAVAPPKDHRSIDDEVMTRSTDVPRSTGASSPPYECDASKIIQEMEQRTKGTYDYLRPERFKSPTQNRQLPKRMTSAPDRMKVEPRSPSIRVRTRHGGATSSTAASRIRAIETQGNGSTPSTPVQRSRSISQQQPSVTRSVSSQGRKVKFDWNNDLRKYKRPSSAQPRGNPFHIDRGQSPDNSPYYNGNPLHSSSSPYSVPSSICAQRLSEPNNFTYPLSYAECCPQNCLDNIWDFVPVERPGDEIRTACNLMEVCIFFSLHFRREALWKVIYQRRYNKTSKPASLITRMTKLPPSERHSWRATVREQVLFELEEPLRSRFEKPKEEARSRWREDSPVGKEHLREPEDIMVLRQVVMDQRTKMVHLNKELKAAQERYNETKQKFLTAEQKLSSNRRWITMSGFADKLPVRVRCQQPPEPPKLILEPRPVHSDPRQRLSMEFIANANNIDLQKEVILQVEESSQRYEQLCMEEQQRSIEMKQYIPDARRAQSTGRRDLTTPTCSSRIGASIGREKHFAFNPANRCLPLRTASASLDNRAISPQTRSNISTPLQKPAPVVTTSTVKANNCNNYNIIKTVPAVNRLALNGGKSLLYQASNIAAERYNMMWSVTGKPPAPPLPTGIATMPMMGLSFDNPHNRTTFGVPLLKKPPGLSVRGI